VPKADIAPSFDHFVGAGNQRRRMIPREIPELPSARKPLPVAAE
jgi:hypothetical protein